MGLVLVRVDERLVHGQVIETWVPYMNAARLVVVDQETADSTLAQMAMKLAVPPGLAVDIVPPGTPGAAEEPPRTIVLTRTVADVERLARVLDLAGRKVPVNVGVVQHVPGRRPISPGVHLSEEEVGILSRLAEAGVKVEVRALPSQPPLGIADVRARFLKAG